MKMKVIAIIGGTQKNQAIKKDGIVPCLTSSMGCGGVLKYRNSYISQDIITKQGIGYAICEKCYLRHEIMKHISVVE